MVKNKANMKRILIVNVNWRGDVLFSTPFIQAIRERYPDGFIACLLVARCVPILQNNPYLNEIIIFDERKEHRGLLGKLNLIRKLRSRHFDIAYLLHRSFTRTLICLLAGIPQRIGYYTRKRGKLLTRSIPQPTKVMHKVEYFLGIARACGIEGKSKDYQFFLRKEDEDYIERMFQEHNINKSNFLIVLNPGGNWDLKRWPRENFAQLAQRLMERFQAKIIITGAKKDLDLAKDIASRMKNQSVILAAKTNLGQLAALMAKVNLVISNDSGPMHIAVSQKSPVICLFGPTSAQITGPYGKGRYIVIQKSVGCPIPCYNLDCQDNRCMKAITVEGVLEAAEQLMNKVNHEDK